VYFESIPFIGMFHLKYKVMSKVKLEFNYNVEDEVFVVYNDKICKCTVLKCMCVCDKKDKQEITYYLSNSTYYKEECVFASVEDCLKYLSDNIQDNSIPF